MAGSSTAPYDPSGDVTAPTAVFTDEQLGAIKTYDDAIAIARAALGHDVESIGEYGNGFEILKDKDTLLGKPFIILEWQFRTGEYGEDGFVSALAVTAGGDKFVLNDGSTGIRAQLTDVTAKRTAAGMPNSRAFLACPNGLRVSRYYTQSVTGAIAREKPADAAPGEWTPSATYYLA